MAGWWLRPLLRLGAAATLPLVVPALVAAVVWALPGDPAEIICPRSTCTGGAELAARWRLDAGPWAFYQAWLGDALGGEFGRSWRVLQGVPVAELLTEAVPNTLVLVGAAGLLVTLAGLGGLTGALGARAEALARAVGVAPAVLLGLLAAASIELRYGADAFGPDAASWRLVAGVAVLVLADGAFGGALAGARAATAAERAARYVGVAVLRGEAPLDNMLPNLAPALVGQLRARLVQLLSGAVVVEVVLRLDGVGDLLWTGTLLQDFGVVIAAATVFAVFSAVLLAAQAVAELIIGGVVRRVPEGLAS